MLKKFSDLPDAKVLLQPTRLDVLRHLARCGGKALFGETHLAIDADVSPQALSEHTMRLERAGFIERRRFIAGRLPATELILTDKARQALADLETTMEVAA